MFQPQITQLKWLILFSASLGIAYGLYTLLNQQHLDQLTLNHSFSKLWRFWGASLALWIGLSFLVRKLKKQHRPTGLIQKQNDSFYTVASLILASSLVIKIALALSPQPRLSTDIWRYLHDGANTCQGINPYDAPPDRIDLKTLSRPRQETVKRINHPHLATIYLPTSQWVFAALWQAKPSADLWGDHTFRIGFSLFDTLTLCFLLLLLKRIGKNPWWAAIYALHPLALTEVAASGHQDAIGVCFFVMAIYFGSFSPIKTWHALIAGTCLALSIWVKPIAGFLIIPLIACHWGQIKTITAALLGGILTTAALWLPLLLLKGSTQGLFITAKAFTGKWAFNGPIHYAINTFIIPSQDKWLTSAIASLAIFFITWRYLKHQPPHQHKAQTLVGASVSFMLASLLLTSTCHPWYLIWLIALLPISFNAPSWLWSLTIAWSYAFYQLQTQQCITAILGVTALEFLPVYSLILWCWIKHNRKTIPQLPSSKTRNAYEPPMP